MKFRLPLVVVAAALLGLMAVLATLQYRWLGRISEAERDRRSATLASQAQAFADDFDRELTRANLIFQWEPVAEVDNLVARVAGRYERWQSTARFPGLICDVLVARAGDQKTILQRFNPTASVLEPVEWPESLKTLRETIAHPVEVPAERTTLIRAFPQPLLPDVPALIVPLPIVVFHAQGERQDLRMASTLSYTVLMLDREHITNHILPALADQHFTRTPDGANFHLAVVHGDEDVVYRSTADFSPAKDARLDASAELFRVRPQAFTEMASELRRISAIVTSTVGGRAGQFIIEPAPSATDVPRTRVEFREWTAAVPLTKDDATAARTAVVAGAATALATRTTTPAQWRLVVQHRAGSLEAAVDATRRRNLAISSGVLGLLAVSMGFLMVSTRRAQRLARQQLEFVAAVSHELRTPLAVIRSAGDNLAEGVVGDGQQVRKYGDLVRREGRRLTEMVEQILEFAGIDSGRRTFVLRPVSLASVVDDVIDASRMLIDERRLRAEVEIPADLPPVLGDEGAVRRVVQNLVGNAIKYGADGGVIRVTASRSGRDVSLTVADKGIGIAASEQERIFEPFYRTPDVIAAQIQGAGLGLSLVKRIVEAHGGRIGVRSAPGAGSEFTVWLPVATEDRVERTASAQAVPEPEGHHSQA